MPFEGEKQKAEAEKEDRFWFFVHVKMWKIFNSKMQKDVELDKEPMQFTKNKEYFFIAWILSPEHALKSCTLLCTQQV